MVRLMVVLSLPGIGSCPAGGRDHVLLVSLADSSSLLASDSRMGLGALLLWAGGDACSGLCWEGRRECCLHRVPCALCIVHLAVYHGHMGSGLVRAAAAGCFTCAVDGWCCV